MCELKHDDGCETCEMEYPGTHEDYGLCSLSSSSGCAPALLPYGMYMLDKVTLSETWCLDI